MLFTPPCQFFGIAGIILRDIELNAYFFSGVRDRTSMKVIHIICNSVVTSIKRGFPGYIRSIDHIYWLLFSVLKEHEICEF